MKTNYQIFAEDLPSKGSSTTKPQRRLWRTPNYTTSNGLIQEEIAKKYVGHGYNPSSFRYKPPALDFHNGYYSEPQGPGMEENFKLDLEDDGTGNGPDPRVVAHELIHINDHRQDNLNAKIWKNLRQLGKSSTSNTWNKFGKSIQRIQNKIDPARDFSKYYPFDEEYIANDIAEGRNKYGLPNPIANQYTASSPGVTASMPAGYGPNSNKLHNDIRAIVTRTNLAMNPHENQSFFLGRGSEFPAFASERMGERWRTEFGKNRLKTPEARFTRNMLKDMRKAYPASEYPEFNQKIHDRQKSVENARTYSEKLAKGGIVNTNKLQKLLLELREMMV